MAEELFNFMTTYGMSMDLALNVVFVFICLGLALFAFFLDLMFEFGHDVFLLCKKLIQVIREKRNKPA